MGLKRSNSMREVDDLHFIFINFNVLALAQFLNRIQTALQLSENITIFAIHDMHTCVISKEGHMNI
jgi:hypothetical protein